MPSSACDWSSDVCSSDRSEEHTSELQSRSDLVCRIISSEEHTSELQSRSDLVCRLLLEKKKTTYVDTNSVRMSTKVTPSGHTLNNAAQVHLPFHDKQCT